MWATAIEECRDERGESWDDVKELLLDWLGQIDQVADLTRRVKRLEETVEYHHNDVLGGLDGPVSKLFEDMESQTLAIAGDIVHIEQTLGIDHDD